MDSNCLSDLRDEILPLLEWIERSAGRDRDDAVVDVVERLRAIDTSVFFPR